MWKEEKKKETEVNQLSERNELGGGAREELTEGVDMHETFQIGSDASDRLQIAASSRSSEW